MPTLLHQLQTIFAQYANPDRAAQQQAYMKSTMPYWGLPKAESDQLAKELFKTAKPKSNDEYHTHVRELIFQASHREEWYAGLLYAQMFKAYMVEENIPLYVDIIRHTQWWDMVDEISVHLIGKVLMDNSKLPEYLYAWIADENMWVRRTALLTQLKYKEKTNFVVLNALILKVAHEKEFFIRKAIGWALREYSSTNPEAVMAFIKEHEDKLVPLSIREGTRIVKVKMPEIYKRYF